MGHVMGKWDVLGAVLRHCPWPEGDFPEEDMQEGPEGDAQDGPPGLWSSLLSVTGGLVLERLAEVGGVGVWAKCCALEHVLHTSPRAGHSTMTVLATPGRV